jgi:UDP-2,3-diacylglucosamine pyrophosphatase LpxH
MPASARITKAYDHSHRMKFSNEDKFIIFSDVHRGKNNWGDDFAHNQLLYFHAMTSYLEDGFTYIEIGDGDELGEIWNFNKIRQAHSHIFWLLRKFHKRGRLYMLYGNHDMVRKYMNRVERTLHNFIDERNGLIEPLFEGLIVHEAIVLEHQETEKEILATHGHQADFFNYYLWWFGKLTLPFWRVLGQQILGLKDPTSPAQNWVKRNKVEQHLIDWTLANSTTMIAGHTHRSRYPPKKGDDNGYEHRYFNDGSCVHPRCITGIEIKYGTIELVKWWLNAKRVENGSGERALYVDRTSMMSHDNAGNPQPIKIADL